MTSSVKETGQKKIEYEILCADENISIDIPKPYLNTVMANLIRNAIQFNDKKFVKLRIEVKNLENQITLSFSDNGPGIPPEEYEKILRNFIRLTNGLPAM